MATFNKIEVFVEDLAHGHHDFTSDALSTQTCAFCTTAQVPVTTDNILGDIAPIVMTNMSSRIVLITSSGHTTGTYKLVNTDLVITASAAVPLFDNFAIYNDDLHAAGPVDPLIMWYLHGSSVTLATSETYTIDFNPTNGFFTLA